MARNAQRIARPASELKAVLKDQVFLLMAHCESYDTGHRAFATEIATKLRVLLHEGGPRSNTRSLLQQLGLRSGRYFTSAWPALDPANLSSTWGLVNLTMGGPNGSSWQTRLRRPERLKREPFPEWWAAPVLRASSVENRPRHQMSRMDVVRSMADMDGGAHVDAGLEATYIAFRTGEMFGFRFSAPGREEDWIASPQFGCVRTIAHEVLLSLQKYAPWAFIRPYEPVWDEW